MDIRSDDHNAYPDSDILSISAEGIMLSTGQLIDYADCARNFHSVHGGRGKCVGERDVTDCSIVFYTAPLTINIGFVGRRWFRPSPIDRFRSLLREITNAGDTTMDES